MKDSGQKDYAVIPASGIPAERVFSKTSDLVAEKFATGFFRVSLMRLSALSLLVKIGGNRGRCERLGYPGPGSGSLRFDENGGLQYHNMQFR